MRGLLPTIQRSARAAAIIAVMAVAIPAGHAEPGKIIWNDLRVGMSAKEVRALYPKGRAQLTDDCYAVVRGSYNENGLSEVRLEWALKDVGWMCGEVVTASLQAKYGDPARRQDAIQQNDCLNPSAGGIAGLLGQLCSAGGADQPSHRVFLQWESNGILITLERDTGSTSNWWAVYKPVVKVSPDAAGKL